MELPQYFPISSDSVPNLEHLRSRVLSDEDIEATEQLMIDAANIFLDDLVNNDISDPEVDSNTFLNELLNAYVSLKKCQSDNVHFNKVFQAVKNDTRQLSRSEPELTVENLNAYRSKSADSNFSQRLNDSLDDPRFKTDNESYKKDPQYQFIKNAQFIIENPDKPLPSEEDDDDIEIEGGNVDLRCPLTMKVFEQPYISRHCGHTFDLAGIKDTWRDGHSQPCPIPGCQRHLRSSDFEPDKLMKLRVKCYNEQQKSNRQAVDYERV